MCDSDALHIQLSPSITLYLSLSPSLQTNAGVKPPRAAASFGRCSFNL